VAAAVLCPGAFAQTQQRSNVPADTDTQISAQQLQAILHRAPVSKDTGKPGEVSTQLFPGGASCSFIRLTEPDLPHVHPVSEIYVVQAGSGTLETGGTMIGPFTNGGVHHQAAANGDQSPNAQRAAEAIGPDHGGTALQVVYLDIKFPKVAAR
jgi:hypothetical protein